MFGQEAKLVEKEAFSLSKEEKLKIYSLTLELNSTQLPAEISDFENLFVLTVIAENKIKLPKSLRKLKNLKKLAFRQPDINRDAFFKEDVSKMDDSTKKYYYEKIYAEIDSFKNARLPLKVKFVALPQVVSLSYGACSLKKFPNNARKLRALQELILTGNFLREVPKALTRFKNLKEVVLNQNQISLQKKVEYQRLKHIPSIYLAKNSIKSLNENVIYFKNASRLNFADNKISFVHEKIFDAENLRGIVLYKNQLTNFQIPAGKWQKLEDLDLYYNRLTAFESRGEGEFLPALQNLYLAFNNISDITNRISHCKNLEEVYLHHNKLSNIHEGFAKLPNIRIFHANNNYLSTFPDFLLRLKNLEELTLYNNSINSLPSPDDLKNFTSLKKFFFAGNLFDTKKLEEPAYRNLLQEWEKRAVNVDF